MTPDLAARIARLIASEIGANPGQVSAAVNLLDGGATVPFVARYRKEVTGGLDDTQLRNLDERLTYLRELEARRAAILSSITEQGKLTDDLSASLTKAMTKAELEDIYLPYKPKRRTRAMIARENGLGPLAEGILADRAADPQHLAQAFLSPEISDTKSALEGARDIIAEGLAEDAALLGKLRNHMKSVGRLAATVVAGKEAEGAKFSDYFAHSEAWH
ncbi:MAG: Tex-like N-terminal domain-containing protein, partial [Pseudorhodobacter sp.]